MKWNTFIDELFKSKLSNTSVPYNPNSWVAMEELLDSELGKTAPKSGLKSTLSKVLFMSSKSLAAASVVSVTMAILPVNNNSNFNNTSISENWNSTQQQLAQLSLNESIHFAELVDAEEVQEITFYEAANANSSAAKASLIKVSSFSANTPPTGGASAASYGSTQNNNNFAALPDNNSEELAMTFMPIQSAQLKTQSSIQTTELEKRAVGELPKSLIKKPIQWNLFAGLNLAKGVGSNLANSVNDNGWIAGVEVKIPITNHLNLMSGLNYSIQKNMDIHYSASKITYGFGKETQITDYQYDELHMASIPVLIEAKLKKHSLALGAFYSRLITTKASINHSIENDLASSVEQNLGSEYGYTQGFAKNDLGIAASYNYALTANLSVGSYVNFGTNDITNNEHFGEHKLDRTFSANVVLRYGFNW